ncbi:MULTISPECIES: hypothetical protein [Catenuloplanes]|uniref:Fe-S cluster assembly iron-binding protein IscA n=1 Tax=Catenuloplanes niger TaxID=587534 RepID=A0AAE3ZWU3_9ACTN|nr:hypothetical protein [Catenuloplanes niger]MDR7327529.1 Fe-S cluster assembly iron-binding protein IscA [Catenuloplanes niger]
MTDNAARALRRMTNTDVYPNAGLSIRKVNDNRFSLSVVPAPADSDIAVPGVNVYMDRSAAAALENARLDANANADLASQMLLSRPH